MFLLRQTPNTLSEECTAFDLVYNSLYIYNLFRIGRSPLALLSSKPSNPPSFPTPQGQRRTAVHPLETAGHTGVWKNTVDLVASSYHIVVYSSNALGTSSDALVNKESGSPHLETSVHFHTHLSVLSRLDPTLLLSSNSWSWRLLVQSLQKIPKKLSIVGVVSIVVC